MLFSVRISLLVFFWSLLQLVSATRNSSDIYQAFNKNFLCRVSISDLLMSLPSLTSKCVCCCFTNLTLLGKSLYTHGCVVTGCRRGVKHCEAIYVVYGFSVSTPGLPMLPFLCQQQFQFPLHNIAKLSTSVTPGFPASLQPCPNASQKCQNQNIIFSGRGTVCSCILLA